MINQLLDDHSITKDRIYGLLNSLSETGADYSDLYFQHSVAESWLLDEGIVKDGSYIISHGVGTRCVKGDKTGFSYSDDLNLKAIQGAIDFAKGISDSPKRQSSGLLKSIDYPSKYPAMSPLESLTPKEKVDLLRQINSIAS